MTGATDKPPQEICYRFLRRRLELAQKRDENGTFNDKETREAVVDAWKMFINCPRPPRWVPEPPQKNDAQLLITGK